MKEETRVSTADSRATHTGELEVRFKDGCKMFYSGKLFVSSCRGSAFAF